ncbi:hypothetical protein K466DRAFT_606112 [Polyporus arcularius HHB13444]|uniref:Uncharacterized protein n=1 Tax=Polyporus arcularius HHB13444 TaxID=1314778 RepID=A0A5C3NSV9_9APHY|nr:hypothetical protein K466DRAFT_606112 [Polyporus arcularius HHB13444]
MPSAEGVLNGLGQCILVPFPPSRQAARPWKERLPLEIDKYLLTLEHDGWLRDLHSILAYFGARHCPSDERCLDMQWCRFAQGVSDIIQDGQVAETTRIAAIARWGREYLPDEVFDDPWWQGRWNWYPPSSPTQPAADPDDESVCDYGEALDGMPVSQGTVLAGGGTARGGYTAGVDVSAWYADAV